MKKLAVLAALTAAMAAWAQTRSLWDGVYTAEQAKRGQAAYAGQCERCHGTQLLGGESAPPLAGIEFFSNWNGLTAGDLFERIRISMPADRPGRLSREDNADIIAYMLSVNQFPAGETELARQPELLKQIQLEMYKPEGRPASK
jgi:cytochrome c